MTWVLFSSTKIDPAALNLLENKPGQKFYQKKTIKAMLQISRKIWVYMGVIGIQSLNIIVLAYVNRVFESLKKKINVFKELFQALPGFRSEL